MKRPQMSRNNRATPEAEAGRLIAASRAARAWPRRRSFSPSNGMAATTGDTATTRSRRSSRAGQAEDGQQAGPRVARAEHDQVGRLDRGQHARGRSGGADAVEADAADPGGGL